MHKLTTGAALIAAFCLAGSFNRCSSDAGNAGSHQVLRLTSTAARKPSRESIEMTNSFPLYGETAIINTAQGVDGGGLFDMSAGYRINAQFGVSLGVSIFSDTGESSVAASIPSPVVINKPANVTATGTGLKHKEVGTSLLLSYFRPYHRQDRSRAVDWPGVLQREPGLHDVIGPDRHAKPESRQHT